MAEKRNVCWFLWKISISVRDPLGRRLHGYDPGVAGQFDSRQNGGVVWDWQFQGRIH